MYGYSDKSRLHEDWLAGKCHDETTSLMLSHLGQYHIFLMCLYSITASLRMQKGREAFVPHLVSGHVSDLELNIAGAITHWPAADNATVE